ncbi:hypothetical protein [Dokdonella sp.]|uniref:hypothetical protein n=1 Tax=Dokdonella sp. TaxID=2291710 RepID=UPI0027B9DD29|nr:hypothetical protein [Dokdonella sp.]
MRSVVAWLFVLAMLGGCSDRLSFSDSVKLAEMSQAPNSGFKRYALDPNGRVVWIVPLAGADLNDIVIAVCTRLPAVEQVKFYNGDVDIATTPATPIAASNCPPRKDADKA